MLENHFQYWVALTLCSLVNLTSLTNHFGKEEKMTHTTGWSRTQWWVVSAACVSLVVSVDACCLHIATKDSFAGKVKEARWVMVPLAMWCASLPFLMDERYMFAVASEHGFICNSNIFFSAWGALIYSLLLATGHLVIWQGLQDAKHVYSWVGFTVSGIVVMCCTARYLIRYYYDNDISDDDTRNRALFGLALGAWSAISGVSVVWFRVDLMVAQLISAFSLVAWCCFAASYLTFDQGPGVPDVGTLYFATWFGLFSILSVAAAFLQDMNLKIFHTLDESGDAAPVNGKDDMVVDSKVADKIDMDEVKVVEAV